MRNTRNLLCCALLIAPISLANPAWAQSDEDAGWKIYAGPSGTRVDIPSKTFAASAGPPEKGVGERFTTTDKRAELSIYVLRNTEGHTPASYLRKYMTERTSNLHYHRVARHFFAVSRFNGDRILYRRCNFSGDRTGTIHCIDLAYPAREKRAWDHPVTRISRSLRPLHS
jgi:hypothetical protein